MEGHEPEMPERSPKGISAETPGSSALDNRNDNGDNMDHDGIVPISEGSSLNHSDLERHINNSAAAGQPVNPVANEENTTLCELSELGMSGSNEMINGELGSMKDSNGSALNHSVALSENEESKLLKDLNGSTFSHSVALFDRELHSTCEPEGVEIGNSRTVSITVPSLSSAETANKFNDVNSGLDANSVEINDSSSKGSDPSKSGVVCFYQCCPGCLHSLYHLTHKILVHERELNRSRWTLEDVHDVVASLSVDIISAVKKIISAEGFKDLSKETLRQEKHGTSLDCLISRMCNPRNLDRVVVPAECMSHSTGHHASGSIDTAFSDLKLDLKFVFRDGVLVQMDPDKDVSLHCKFETLCLCSFKELIVMTKHPFD